MNFRWVLIGTCHLLVLACLIVQEISADLGGNIAKMDTSAKVNIIAALAFLRLDGINESLQSNAS